MDNSIICFSDQLNNGIHVPSYFGQNEEDCLLSTLDLLKNIAYTDNVQEELKKRLQIKNLYEEYLVNN